MNLGCSRNVVIKQNSVVGCFLQHVKPCPLWNVVAGTNVVVIWREIKRPCYKVCVFRES